MDTSTFSPASSASIPLRGVKVVEISQIISGPFCTMMLSGLGADVAKIEMPGQGDELRSIGRYEGREQHEDYFNANNYGKRSVALDLKSEDGLRAAFDLVAKADVVVENLAPGTTARLGLGFDAVKQINPRIVYCSISGFGQVGPLRHAPAVDNIIQAASGIMSVTGEADGPPTQVGAPLADVTASMCAASAILGALYGVCKDGVARYIDISMQAAFVYALSPRMGGVLQGAAPPQRLGNQNPMRVPSDVYRTADGVDVFLIVPNDRSWGPFCRALQRPDWLAEARFATNRLRTANRAAINAMVHEEIGHWRSEVLMRELNAQRIPFARVNDYAQAVSDPQVAARGLVHEVEHVSSGTLRVIGPPWIINGERLELAPPPALGQHTDSVLADWLAGQSQVGEEA